MIDFICNKLQIYTYPIRSLFFLRYREEEPCVCYKKLYEKTFLTDSPLTYFGHDRYMDVLDFMQRYAQCSTKTCRPFTFADKFINRYFITFYSWVFSWSYFITKLMLYLYNKN